MNQENPSSPSGITRREFFRRVGLLGGGLIVYISFGDSFSQARDEADFNAYLRIGADGRVTCFSGKIEMGQGIITSLAQMLADELRVPFDSVDMVLGDTSRCPWDMGTFGSMSRGRGKNRSPSDGRGAAGCRTG
jgi:nicotinate dehydrogenase subunit B